MTAGSARAVQMATDRTRQAYEGFDGQRIADLSQSEQFGISDAQGQRGAYDADYDKARGALEGISSFTDEGVREKYMNPYIEGVLQPGVRRRDRAFGERRGELRRTAGMRNAFGGRQNVAENLLETSHQEGIDDLYQAGYGRAFESAASLHGAEQDRSIRQAGAYAGVAESQGQQARANIQQLMKSGLTQRTQEQADLDFKYIEHLEERDWDVSNLNTLVQTLASVPHDITETSVTTQESKDDPMKAIAGIAMIAGSAIMTGGASLTNPAIWGAGLGLATGTSVDTTAFGDEGE